MFLVKQTQENAHLIAPGTDASRTPDCHRLVSCDVGKRVRIPCCQVNANHLHQVGVLRFV